MSYIFDGNETPDQRTARIRAQMAASMPAAAPSQMPRDLGEGMMAMADALNRRNQANYAQQAATDPWFGMREPTGEGLFSGIGKKLTGLFGLGGKAA